MANEGDQLTPEQYEYFLKHSSDDRGPSLIVCSSVTSALCTAFLLLRLLGRRMTHHRWYVHISDWFLIVAWVLFLGAAVSLGLSTRYGDGRHIIFVTNRRMLQIFSIVMEATYSGSMAFLKLSILALYGSIFPNRRFHYWIWAMGIFIVSWALMSAIGGICQCIPIESFWNESISGHCIQYGYLQLIATLCNIITDFIILLMPIPLVRRLHTSKENKRLLHFSFAMGGSACIVSIIRLVYSLQVGSLDGSWTAMPAAYLSEAEICVGFLVVSMPIYRPIYHKIVHGTTHSKKSDPSTGPGYQVKIGSNNTASRLVQISHNRTFNSVTPGISVTEDIELVRHAQRDGTWVRVSDENNNDDRLYEPSFFLESGRDSV